MISFSKEAIMQHLSIESFTAMDLSKDTKVPNIIHPILYQIFKFVLSQIDNFYQALKVLTMIDSEIVPEIMIR